MAASNTHVAYPLDTVVRDHHVYISVWSPVIGVDFILDKELAGWLIHMI